MTVIAPFKAIYYNSDKIEDLSTIVCPPYDVISKDQQNTYYNKNEYNFIRVLLPKDQTSDSRNPDKYMRAKEDFERWLKEGILKQDTQECLYYYKQEYKICGERHSRLGFISLMKLHDDDESNIFPHEHTHLSPKEDRLKLWRTLSSNLSPIFVCFSDKEKKVEKAFLKKVSHNDPIIDIIDDDAVRHIVWPLSDPLLIEDISKSISNQQLFIADGHHRYEVAMEYRRIKMGRSHTHNGEESYNYIMTYFTNMDSRDLKIFPMHRIVRHMPEEMDFLEEFFRIDKLKNKEELAILLAKAGQNEHAFGLYARDGIKLLRLKNKLLIDKHVTEGSKEFRHLDATILKTFVFDRVHVKSEDIQYTKDLNEAIEAVDSKEAAVSFIMNPVKIQQLKDIALNEERMPPKTTYFYPKVLSGLMVYHMK